MKKLFALVGVLTLVLVGLLVATFLSINPIIEEAVNKVGPKVLNTQVSLGNANVSFMSGSGSLSDLFVGSPAGFKAPQTMKLDELSVDLDTASLTEDTIIINSIVINKPDLTYEKKGKLDNFTALLNSVNKYAGSKSTPAAKSDNESAKDGESSSGRKVIIKDLLITGAKVNVAMTQLGGEGMSVELGDIHMTNIGEDKGGTTPAEALQQILAILNTSITTSVSKAISDVAKQVQNNLKDIESTLKNGPKSLDDIQKSGKSLEDTAKGLKKLFN